VVKGIKLLTIADGQGTELIGKYVHMMQHPLE
jgi:hypothetical protein